MKEEKNSRSGAPAATRNANIRETPKVPFGASSPQEPPPRSKLRKSRPQLTVATPSPPPYGPASPDGSHTPKTPSRLRHGVGVSDAERSSGEDYFTLEAPSPTKPNKPASNDDNSWWAISKRLRHAPPSSAYSRSSNGSLVSSTASLYMAKPLPPTPTQQSKLTAEGESQPGTPSASKPHGGQESPRDLPLLSPEEKRLTRIKAGYDIVLRGTQLGLAPKKLIHEVTEEDLEAVGLAGTIYWKDASGLKASNILRSFFRKMHGTTGDQDQRQQADAIRINLRNRDSLRFLTDPEFQQVRAATKEQKAHWEVVLNNLTTASTEDPKRSPFDDLPQESKTSPVGLGISGPSNNQLSEKNLAATQQALETANHYGRPLTTIEEDTVERASEVSQPFDLELDDARSESSHYSDDENDEKRTTIFSHPATNSMPAAASQEEAVPEPLNVPKHRRRPSGIPVLHVSRSSKQLDTDEGPFSPKRDSTFMRGIKQASAKKDAKLHSHPALRGGGDSSPDTVPTSPVSPISPMSEGYPTSLKSSTELARVDSGFVMVSSDSDEGYGTGYVDQWQFDGQCHSDSSKHTRTGSGKASRPSSHKRSMSEGRPSADIDMQKLRGEMGLEYLKLPVGEDCLRHPHHPFTWDHQKIMCRTVHNDTTELPQPPLPKTSTPGPVNLRHMESLYFNQDKSSNNKAKTTLEAPQKCSLCGKRCCHFADLLVASLGIDPDLEESASRIKARNRVSVLRSSHPNGIEEYETFLECAHCGRKVCPSCADMCDEDLCQAIFCSACSNGFEQCPVHNI
jgi:hypothetical protein